MDGGSPKAAKDKRNDDTRFQNIQSISYAIKSYYRSSFTLPQTTAAVVGTSYNLTALPVDPETKSEYEYSILNPQEFQICATFKTNTQTSQDFLSPQAHPSGYYCYKFDIAN